MTFGGDDRGQSIQVGAVLLFGALVVSLSAYQAFVVPQQNKQVEFNHNQNVQQQLQQLRDVIVSMPGEPATRSVSIRLGTRYPSRLIAINPGPPTGTLRTVATTDRSINVSVANASTAGETGDVWNGTMRNYSTGGLVYQPNYNEYQNPPTTVYENTVLYNQFDSGNVTLAGQSLVDGKRLTLVVLNGSLQASSAGTASVDVKPMSVSTNTVSVTNASDGSNVTIRIPTELTESQWESLLDEEFTNEGGHVYNVTVEPYPGSSEFDMLVLRLEPNVTYQLRLAKVGVGTGTERDSERYLTDIDGDGSSVSEGGTTQLVVEVRDGLNNPVSGVEVDAATNGTGTVSLASNQTDADGQVTLEYQAPADIDGGSQPAEVNASIAVDPDTASSFDPRTFQNVTMQVTVLNSDGSGSGGGGGGSSGPYDVVWEDPSAQTGVSCPNGPDGVCTVDASQISEVNLTMDTSPTVDGASVEYAVNNTTIGTVDPKSGTTNSNGANSTNLTVINDGFIEVFTTSGASGDSIVLEIINTVNDIVFKDDAQAKDGPDSDLVSGGVEFTVTNKFSQNVEILSVKVTDPAGQAARINDEVSPNDEPQRTEIYVAGDVNDGWVDANGGVDLPFTFDMDNDGFNNNGNPEASSGEEFTFYLYEFEKNNGDRVSMSGESFDVTITYQLANGTTGTKTFTVNVA